MPCGKNTFLTETIHMRYVRQQFLRHSACKKMGFRYEDTKTHDGSNADNKPYGQENILGNYEAVGYE